MSTKYMAGDFPSGTELAEGGTLSLMLPCTKFFQMSKDCIHLGEEAIRIEVVTEENKSSLLGKVGWGAAGFALLGPLGILAALFSGRKTEVCIMCELRDGRKFMGTCGLAAYQGTLAAIMDRKRQDYRIPNINDSGGHYQAGKSISSGETERASEYRIPGVND